MQYIKLINLIKKVENNRNKDLKDLPLLGINIEKEFIPSVANVIGTNMSKYQIVKKMQFACNPMHLGRDERMPISLLLQADEILVSPAYFVFEVTDKNILLPEYLMLYLKRNETDRFLWFKTDSSVRGGLVWERMCEIEIPVPSIDEQVSIVKQYNQITQAINLKHKLNNNLERQAQTIFKSWFVDFCKPEAEYCLGDFFKILKGKNITKDTAISGNIPVVAGGLTPAYYHNKFNAIAPVVTVSASGINAGFVNFYTKNIWVSDCSYFDFKNGIQVYFVYCLLKERQSDIYLMQTGSAQPHIYPKNIMKLPIPYVDYQIVNKFGKITAPLFNIIKINQEHCNILQQLRDTLLPKLMSDESSDKLSFKQIFTVFSFLYLAKLFLNLYFLMNLFTYRTCNPNEQRISHYIHLQILRNYLYTPYIQMFLIKFFYLLIQNLGN